MIAICHSYSCPRCAVLPLIAYQMSRSCLFRTCCVRSHVSWRGERSILYTSVNPKGKAQRRQCLLTVDLGHYMLSMADACFKPILPTFISYKFLLFHVVSIRGVQSSKSCLHRPMLKCPKRYYRGRDMTSSHFFILEVYAIKVNVVT